MSLEVDQKTSAKTPPKDSRLVRVGYAVCGLIVLFSVLRMIWVIQNGSRLQYADYWMMIESLLQPDGSLNLSGILNFSNHHFVAFPQFLYWLNIKFFAGSNIALGLIDVAIVCCLVGVLILMIRRSSLDRALQLAIISLTGALLFGLSGSWNFTRGMSGAAWLSANLFVVAAIYLRTLDRNYAALAVAVLATMSYGTGVFAWPAIIVVGLVRRPFLQWWKEWPYAIGLVLSVVVVKTLSNSSGDTSTNDFLLIGQLAANFLGSSVGLSGGLAETAGWVVLVGTPLLAVWLGLFVRPQIDSGWIGLAAYGWSAILVITQGRAVFMAIYGYQGRYYSLAAVTWLGFLVMVILALERFSGFISRRLGQPVKNPPESAIGKAGLNKSFVPYLLILPLTVGALISGHSEVENRDLRIYDQELKEIALQLNVVDGSVGYLEGFSNNTKPFDSTHSLELVGHFPFVDDWSLDCGLLGKTLQKYSNLRRGGEVRRVVPEKGLDSVSRIGGIIPAEAIMQGSIRCIVVTDPHDLVVGVGTVRPKSSGKIKQHFSALAHGIEGDYRVYIFDDGIGPVLLSGRDVASGGAN